MPDTSAPVGGTVTSGVKMNRDNTTFPDAEQERRLQARQEHEKAQGLRAEHPPFTRDPQTASVQVAKQND